MAEPITRRDVLLSWALAEALSPRWAERYEGVLSAGYATDPAALTPMEQAMLLSTVQTHRKRIVETYIEPCSRFELEVIRPAQVAELPLMPRMTSSREIRRVTLGSYLKGRYDPQLAHDPRNAARAILETPTPAPYFGFPILAWDDDLQCDVIVEGYARLLYALMRMEQGDKLMNIVCIFCHR